jgi:ABC-type nitrate/sulfonate/bicarbonate transport system substrate-binding protein
MRSMAVALVLVSATASARTPVSLIVTERDNLQNLPLFVAIGAGYFRDAGLDVTLAPAPTPGEVVDLLHPTEDQVAILPPPIYLQLIADKFPLVIVANLLQNDPIDLVVAPKVAHAHALSATAPLAERLRALAGLRVGVAPGPIRRLRALYKSQGLDADQLLTIVTLMGQEQNEALATGKVDALYAHTPFLERALVEQGAVMIVNQSAGDAPALSTRMIHAVVATRGFASHRAADLRRLVRAIAQAERLIAGDRAAATRAVLAALPDRSPRLVERIVAIYQPAVPATPDVSVDGLRSALALFPASKRAPDLSAVDLGAFVDDRFARAARAR